MIQWALRNCVCRRDSGKRKEVTTLFATRPFKDNYILWVSINQDSVTSFYEKREVFFMPSASNSKQKEYDKKRAGRTRNWAAIGYPEDLPLDWKSRITRTRIQWTCGPLHDQDFEEGKHKKDHYHTILKFSTVKTEKQVMQFLGDLFGWGGNSGNSVIGFAKVEVVQSMVGSIRYMAHLDNPEKAQYDPGQIVGYNGMDPEEYLHRSQAEVREMTIEMEEYIEAHNIIELCDFARAIRYEHPDWYTVLSTRMTYYFNSFIRSRRGAHLNVVGQASDGLQPVADGYSVDPETGEAVGPKGPCSRPEWSTAKEDPCPCDDPEGKEALEAGEYICGDCRYCKMTDEE